MSYPKPGTYCPKHIENDLAPGEDRCRYCRIFADWLGEQVDAGGTTMQVGERVERGATDTLVDGVCADACADTEPAALFCDACVYCGEACPAMEEYCSADCQDAHRREMACARALEQRIAEDVEDATCADPFDSDHFASAALDETSEHKAHNPEAAE